MDRELSIRHLSVDEALWQLDQYLYDAYMADLSSVCIVHGKGTGKLRRAVHDSLARHPLVESYRLGDYGQGNYGVTIVELINR